MSLPCEGHVIVAFRPTTYDTAKKRWNVEQECSCGKTEPHDPYADPKAKT